MVGVDNVVSMIKIERFRRCVKLAKYRGCFHCQGIRIFDQICRPYILPNAVRRHVALTQLMPPSRLSCTVFTPVGTVI